MPAEIPFTEEIQQRIYNLLGTKTMNEICRMDDMPSNSTIIKWYTLYPNFHDNCRRVRDLRADEELERHRQIIEDVIDGTIAPDAARVVLSALEWRTKQLDRARYGDKPSSLTINSSVDNRRVDVNFESLKLASKDVLEAAKRQIEHAHAINSDNDEK
jgi:hypothetical protein